MRTHDLRIALVLALASAALAACDRPADGTARTANGETVGQKVDRSVDRTQAELARAGEKIKEAAGSDAAITASIKADYLKDPDLSVFKIDVDTNDGVVTLNGVADTAAAKSRAEKMAGAVKGVKEVRNHLSVKQG